MSSEVKLPRGLRNNNPLNIRLSKDRWQGQIAPSLSGNRGIVAIGELCDGGQRAGGEASFCQFETMAYGWRAAFRLLCNTYYKKYGLRTIRAIINRWAPPNENGTLAYIRSVAERTGISADKELGDPATHAAQWLMIGMAMAIVENGTTNQDYLSMLKGYSLAMGE